jgi:hypothetical protein
MEREGYYSPHPVKNNGNDETRRVLPSSPCVELGHVWERPNRRKVLEIEVLLAVEGAGDLQIRGGKCIRMIESITSSTLIHAVIST